MSLMRSLNGRLLAIAPDLETALRVDLSGEPDFAPLVANDDASRFVLNGSAEDSKIAQQDVTRTRRRFGGGCRSSFRRPRRSGTRSERGWTGGGLRLPLPLRHRGGLVMDAARAAAIALSSEAPEALPTDEAALRAWLTERVAHLLATQPALLLSHLYRVDVREKDVRAALAAPDPTAALVQALLDREAEKARYRATRP